MNAPILLEATQEAELDAAFGLRAREAKDRLERGGRHATVDVSPKRVAVSKPEAQVPVFMMVTGDFLAISSSVDNARSSSKPSLWSSRNLTFAGVAMGVVDLASLGLGDRALQTLAVVTPVFSGQTLLYVAREREHIWSSLPSRQLVASWVADVASVTALAVNGILMARLPITIIGTLPAAAAVFAFFLDGAKRATFERCPVARPHVKHPQPGVMAGV